MDIELRNDRIPRNPFDRQFLDMGRRNFFLGSSVGTSERFSVADLPTPTHFAGDGSSPPHIFQYGMRAKMFYIQF